MTKNFRAEQMLSSGSASKSQLLNQPFIPVPYSLVQFHLMRGFVRLALLGFSGSGE